MLLCAHAYYLEHIFFVSINKIPQLIEQKSNNFLCNYSDYLVCLLCTRDSLFPLSIKLLIKTKIKTDCNGKNFNWVWVSHYKHWCMLKSIDRNTKYTHILDGILCIFWEEFYQTAEPHSPEKQTSLKTNVFVMKVQNYFNLLILRISHRHKMLFIVNKESQRVTWSKPSSLSQIGNSLNWPKPGHPRLASISLTEAKALNPTHWRENNPSPF